MGPSMLERGASFKEFLSNRPEKEIIVISSNLFLDSLMKTDQDFRTMECRSCTWKNTISGRKTLVEIRRDVSEPVQDDDYGSYWRSDERSELFYKWYTKPFPAIFQKLRCKREDPDYYDWELRHLKYLMADETEEKLREEAGPDFRSR
jgi:hypothetical protein